MSMKNEPLNKIMGYDSLSFALATASMANKIPSFVALPGTGKSALMASVAEWGPSVLPADIDPEELPAGWKPDVFTIYVPQHDDIEFHMPSVHPKTNEYTLVPSPLLTRLTLACYQVFDEWTMDGCQRMMLQMCNGERITCGPWVGPRGVRRVLIGNTADSGNFSFIDNAVLGNRLAQYEWTPLFNEWLKDFALPYGIHPLIGAAVKLEGQSLFLDYDAARNRNSTPRSLTNASDLMIAAEEYTDKTLDTGQRMTLLSSCLHDEVALKIQSLFTLHDKLVPFSAIVAQPDTAPIPENPAANFMTCASVSRQCQPEHWSAVMGWVNRLPLELRGSVVEPIVKRHPAMISTKEFNQYNIDTAPLVV